MRLGKNEKEALNFALKYPGWHCYRNDRSTKNAIKSLQKKGKVEINKFNQFKAI